MVDGITQEVFIIGLAHCIEIRILSFLVNFWPKLEIILPT